MNLKKVVFAVISLTVIILFYVACPADVIKGDTPNVPKLYISNFDDDSVKQMSDIEHEADDITHDIIFKLNSTFITPFDREDIHSLAKELDDVVDMLYTITKRMRLYKLNVINEDLISFAALMEKSIYCLGRAINGLRNSKNQKPIMQL